jgi:NADH-quinone oxidoreductase subunit I
MWGTGMVKGMVATMRNMMRGPITVQYPDERLELPERARWTVTPTFGEDGAPKCTACLACVKACPDHILHLDVSTGAEGRKHIDAYVYELGACMMCGLCVEACPYDAIEMSHEYELAVATKAPLVRVLLSDVDAAPPKRARSAGAPGASGEGGSDA